MAVPGCFSEGVMSSKTRDLIAILMVFLLVILSFGAGYLVNELVQTSFGSSSIDSLDDQL